MTMTPDDILRMAREAGARVECWMTNPPKPALINLTPEQLERFAALVAEKCAKLCEEEAEAHEEFKNTQAAIGCDGCTNAIRTWSQP